MGEAIGALVGEVLEFAGDDNGMAIGRCVRVKVLVEVSKPLLRWTSVSFGGASPIRKNSRFLLPLRPARPP